MKNLCFTTCTFPFLFGFIICSESCSKSGGGYNNPPSSTPSASINNVSKDRGTTSSVYEFQVSLSAKAPSDATIHYATVEGTAKEGTDFTSTSGTITIPAGETKATIDITVTGDSLRKLNQLFYV